MDGDQPIKTIEMLIRVIQDDLLPLLEEYCYEDYQALEQILGKALVDSENQRYRLELFGDDQQDMYPEHVICWNS
jgi:5-methylcytosine-specific restriction protein B